MEDMTGKKHAFSAIGVDYIESVEKALQVCVLSQCFLELSSGEEQALKGRKGQ